MNEKLQERYPVMRDGEEVYVLREHLTLEERKEIIANEWLMAISKQPAECVRAIVRSRYLRTLPLKEEQRQEIQKWLIEAASKRPQAQATLPEIIEEGWQLVTDFPQYRPLGPRLIQELAQALPLKETRVRKIARRINRAYDLLERGQTLGPHPPRRPRSEESPARIRAAMKAAWKRFVLGKPWSKIPDRKVHTSRPEEILRQQVKRLSKMVFDAMVEDWFWGGLYPELERSEKQRSYTQNWANSDERWLDAYLSSDEGKTFLASKFFLPFQHEEANSIRLAKALFHLGRTGRLDWLKPSLHLKTDPPK